ncbi:hypothetical protein [Dongia sp. agr-C8]
MRFMKAAAAALAFGALAVCALAPAAALAEGKKIDCSDTSFEFDAPGYVVDCKDASQNSVDVSGGTITLKIYSLHAVSQADSTFLDVVSDHILGNSGVFYRKSSLQSNITRYYNGDFNGWADEEDVGNYTVKRVTADFKDGNDPMDCFAFQQMGARRYEGIAGMTVGLVCSMDGRDKAMTALKHLAGE